MVNYRKLSVYLPEELYQTLIAYREQHKFEAASEAVVEILSQFFEKDNEVKRYTTVEQLKTLENKVAHLSHQVTQLYPIIASSAPTPAARTVPTESNDCSFGNPSFDELEDEPDEILQDFLEPGSPPPSSPS